MTEHTTPDGFNCPEFTPFAIVGVAALSLILMPYTGLPYLTIGILVATITAIIGLIVGILGFAKYSRTGLFHDDPFHMMGVLISAGLLVFALADITNAVAIAQPENFVLPYMVSAARATALILWILGMTGYIRASNSVLGFVFPRLWAVTLVLCSIAVMIALPVLLNGSTQFGPVESMWILSYSLILGLLTSAVFVQYHSLKEGELGKLLRYILLGFIAMYLHGLLAWYISIEFIIVVLAVLAIEGYILIGGFLLCAQQLVVYAGEERS
jgi:hypothetical protein